MLSKRQNFIQFYEKLKKKCFNYKKYNSNPSYKKTELKAHLFRKYVRNNPRTISFNQSKVKTSDRNKYLGVILDSELILNEQFQRKISKCNKMFGSVQKLSLILPRTSVLNIYKNFPRPHLGFTDIAYYLLVAIMKSS